MDFHTHQDEAKQSTAKLVLLLGAGVLAIMVMVSLLIGALFFYDSGEVSVVSAIGIAAPLTLIGVGGASAIKSAQLKGGGGSYVAQSMGGRQIDFNTLDPSEKQLANIVEEMAIASGLPVPEVFVLDNEQGINAFAAGWTADNAAIGVTRGALDHFTRRELQGVIAHEFSHIANGDMRVKTRIIGWVFGISVLTVLGRLLLEWMFWAPRRRDSKDNSAAAIAALGFGLLIIGAVGTVFARLVQAAVNRQREYLADASAVQYTRDPGSIGEALVKIGSISDNKMHAAHATEAGHLFFTSGLSSAFATHPPLRDRIRRVMPDWNGEFGQLDVEHRAPVDPRASGLVGGAASHGSSEVRQTPPPPPPTTSQAFERPTFTGPTEAHIDHTRALLAAIPKSTHDFLLTPQGAVAAVLGSLVSDDPAVRHGELDEIGEFLAMAPSELEAASVTISSLDRTLQLPAIDIALQAIRRLSWQSRERLAQVVDSLHAWQTDGDVFRWVLRRALLRHLADQADDGRMSHDVPLVAVKSDAIDVLSIVAHFNSQGAHEAQSTFDSALRSIGWPSQQIPDNAELTYARLDDALEHLSHIDRPSRRAFVSAAADIVLSDGRATAHEAELLRVVADAVRLPVPPLLPAGGPS